MSDSLAERLEGLSPKKRAVLMRRLRSLDDSLADGVVPLGRRDRAFPLSFSQQRLWFLDQLEAGNSTYNVPVAVRLQAAVNVPALAQAMNHLVRRHESLRTTFELRGAQAVQVVADARPLALAVVDLSSLAATAREQQVKKLALAHAQRPFALTSGPLLRVTLVQLDDHEAALLFATHHIVSDGWSMGIFIQELGTLYEAYCSGKPAALPDLGVQYADYAVWQRSRLQGNALAEQVAYWKRRLDGAAPLLRLPTDRPRPAVERYAGAVQPVHFPGSLCEALATLGRTHDATLFMTLLAAFQTLLYRYCGAKDILVGTPVAGRNRPEIEGLIGFFVNTLVLRTDLSGNPPFAELLRRVRQTTLEAFAHQELPFEKLVEALQPERSLGNAPVFQVMFTFLNEPTRRPLQLAGLQWSVLEIDRGRANRDLTLRLAHDNGELNGHFEYNSDLFEAATIRRLAARFHTLLADIVARPDALIDALELLSEKEQRANDQPDSRYRSFRQALGSRPKAVNLDSQAWVKIGLLDGGEALPCVLRPAFKEVDIVEWSRQNRPLLQCQLFKHGGLLFRDFDLSAPGRFRDFCQAISGELADYSERSTPRHEVEHQVYTSTEYPDDQFIMLHNEVSYSHQWPMKIWFYCAQPAVQGGATPVADSREVFKRLDPFLRERFERCGVMYVRNFGEDLDLPWQEVFGTNDRAKVEHYCRECGIDFSWRGDNRLRTRQCRHAVARHPQTEEMVWFNSAHMFHVSALPAAVRESMQELLAEEDLPRHVYYGDGSPIHADEIEHIRNVYRSTAVRFPWQQGDVLLLDNMLAAHGREPFAGPRKVLVAMAEPMTSDWKKPAEIVTATTLSSSSR